MIQHAAINSYSVYVCGVSSRFEPVGCLDVERFAACDAMRLMDSVANRYGLNPISDCHSTAGLDAWISLSDQLTAQNRQSVFRKLRIKSSSGVHQGICDGIKSPCIYRMQKRLPVMVVLGLNDALNDCIMVCARSFGYAADCMWQELLKRPAMFDLCQEVLKTCRNTTAAARLNYLGGLNQIIYTMWQPTLLDFLDASSFLCEGAVSDY
jgi:hypothetical protein